MGFAHKIRRSAKFPSFSRRGIRSRLTKPSSNCDTSRCMPTLAAFTDAGQYIETISPFLEASEPENGFLLGALDLVRSDSPALPPVMIQIEQDGETIAAAFYRDRELIVAGDLENAAELLAKHLSEAGVNVPGVRGPALSAGQFAEVWSRIRGCPAKQTMNQGLYWLKNLDWPAPVAGRMRPMTTDDIPLVARWIFAFQREAVPFDAGSPDDARKNAEARPDRKMTFIWDVDGAPVSMAGLTRPTRHGITVNAVYTPPEFRGRGYATALVAFVTDEGLKRGKGFCSLYTDLANPTSNSIYMKIGYRLLSYSRTYRFS
jgi:uncharacterized protein